MTAYRAGSYLGDTAKGETFEYTRKEGIAWSHIFTSDKASTWANQRQELWNQAEAAEIRKDARLAREIVASLPREAGPEAWQTMVGDMAAQFTQYGLVVDASIHEVKASDGGDNPHVHLLITDRPVDESGFCVSKKELRFLNGRPALQGWRQTWEELTNRALEAAGIDERLSLASYHARGIDLEPTKPLGPKASKLEKRGIATKEGNENRRIREDNRRRKLELEGGPTSPLLPRDQITKPWKGAIIAEAETSTIEIAPEQTPAAPP